MFFLKNKTAYEMRISDWSSDVCSSDLHGNRRINAHRSDGIVARLGHRLQKTADVFLRVAERLLTIEQQRRIVRRGCIRAFDDGGKLLQLVLGLLQPFLIGRGLGEIDRKSTRLNSSH